jgi:hypothetical protein
MTRYLGPEAARNLDRRPREDFIEKYLSGNAVLDIGYRGADPECQPITEKAADTCASRSPRCRARARRADRAMLVFGLAVRFRDGRVSFQDFIVS